MGESQLPGMEHVALEFSASAVDRIARHGLAEVLQVDANLVGAAGFGMALHEGFSLAGIEHAIVRERLATALHDGHFLAVDGMPSDGRLDFAVGHAGDAIREGEVGFFDMARRELICE
jgi:hypothetical protein